MPLYVYPSGRSFLGGGLGLESLGGHYAFLHGEDNLTSELFCVVEESLEMAGLLVWIHALFLVMRSSTSEWIVVYKRGAT